MASNKYNSKDIMPGTVIIRKNINSNFSLARAHLKHYNNSQSDCEGSPYSGKSRALISYSADAKYLPNNAGLRINNPGIRSTVLRKPVGYQLDYPRHDCCSVNALPPPPAHHCDRCRRPLTLQEISFYRRNSPVTKSVNSSYAKIPLPRNVIHKDKRIEVLQKLSKDASSLFRQSTMVLQNIEKLKHNIRTAKPKVARNHSPKDLREIKDAREIATQTKEIPSKKNKHVQTQEPEPEIELKNQISFCEVAVGNDDDDYSLQNAITQTEILEEEVPEDVKPSEMTITSSNFPNKHEIFSLSCTNALTNKETLSDFVKNRMPIESLLADRYRRVFCHQDPIAQEPSFSDPSERLISITEESSSLTGARAGGAGEEYFSDGEDNKKYINFAEAITKDVLTRQSFSDESICRIFRAHMRANRKYLKEGKMLEQIYYLSDALKLRLAYDKMSRTVLNIDSETRLNSSSDTSMVCDSLVDTEFHDAEETCDRYRAGRDEDWSDWSEEDDAQEKNRKEEDKNLLRGFPENPPKCVKINEAITSIGNIRSQLCTDPSCASNNKSISKVSQQTSVTNPQLTSPRLSAPSGIPVAKKHYCSNMDSRLLQNKKTSSQFSRKLDKPDILIEVKSSTPKKSTINKQEIKSALVDVDSDKKPTVEIANCMIKTEDANTVVNLNDTCSSVNKKVYIKNTVTTPDAGNINKRVNMRNTSITSAAINLDCNIANKKVCVKSTPNNTALTNYDDGNTNKRVNIRGTTIASVAANLDDKKVCIKSTPTIDIVTNSNNINTNKNICLKNNFTTSSISNYYDINNNKKVCPKSARGNSTVMNSDAIDNNVCSKSTPTASAPCARNCPITIARPSSANEQRKPETIKSIKSISKNLNDRKLQNDKSMQVEKLPKVNQYVSAVSETTDEFSQAVTPTYQENKLIETMPLPIIIDASTSDGLILKNDYKFVESDDINNSAEDEPSSSYDTILTITMKRGQEDGSSSVLENIQEHRNLEDVNPFPSLPPNTTETYSYVAKRNDPRLLISAQTSARSVGGAEKPSETNSAQTEGTEFCKFAKKEESEIPVFDPRLFVKNSERYGFPSHPKTTISTSTSDTQMAKKKVSILEHLGKEKVVDDDIRLVYQKPSLVELPSSLPASVDQITAKILPKEKKSKTSGIKTKSREFCCWKTYSGSEEDEGQIFRSQRGSYSEQSLQMEEIDPDSKLSRRYSEKDMPTEVIPNEDTSTIITTTSDVEVQPPRDEPAPSRAPPTRPPPPATEVLPRVPTQLLALPERRLSPQTRAQRAQSTKEQRRTREPPLPSAQIPLEELSEAQQRVQDQLRTQGQPTSQEEPSLSEATLSLEQAEVERRQLIRERQESVELQESQDLQRAQEQPYGLEQSQRPDQRAPAGQPPQDQNQRPRQVTIDRSNLTEQKEKYPGGMLKKATIQATSAVEARRRTSVASPQGRPIIVDTHRATHMQTASTTASGTPIHTILKTPSAGSSNLTTRFSTVSSEDIEKAPVKQYTAETKEVLGRLGIDVEKPSVLVIPQKAVISPQVEAERRRTARSGNEIDPEDARATAANGTDETPSVTERNSVGKSVALTISAGHFIFKDFSEEKISLSEDEDDPNMKLTDLISQVDIS